MNEPAEIDIATPIIDKFGGCNQMSKDTEIPYGRIHHWQKAGYIPDKWRPSILAHARRLGVDHTPWDYIAHLVDLKLELAA